MARLPRDMKVKFHRKIEEIVEAFQDYEDGKCNIFMVVYHGNHRANVRKFGDGFQPTPWRCRKCRRVAYRDDLKYDIGSVPVKGEK